MNIYVTAALGKGKTTLGAFDNALVGMGVANYNLVRLSSVIPPATEIVICDGPAPSMGGTWGDKLYCVYAEQRADIVGQQAWAGVGWVQDPTDGKGLFVEHEGHSEEYVVNEITQSLQTLMTNRNMQPLPIQMKVVGGTCESVSEPICAMVMNTYESEPWNT
jgi:arginine decarboxylase